MSISLAELREARGIVAELANRNPRLQPVYDHLARECERREAQPRMSKMQVEAMRRADLRGLA